MDIFVRILSSRSGMKAALQLYTLRDYLKTPEVVDETFKRVKTIGYDTVQVSGMGDIDEAKASAVKTAAEKYGLTICATHISLSQLTREFDWVVKFHKLWNCKYLGIGMMPNEYQSNIAAFIDIMNEYGEKLKTEGISLLYHNHAFEFGKRNGEAIINQLYQGFKNDVQFEIDTYWVQKGGNNPVSWINKVKGRMDVVHFKDMGVKNWDEQFMETVGAGNLEWDAIIKACENNGVKYACVEQDDTQGRDAFMCAETSLKFLKSKGLD